MSRQDWSQAARVAVLVVVFAFVAIVCVSILIQYVIQ